jgi:two-component system chemotaxis sensor kinase CheA
MVTDLSNKIEDLAVMLLITGESDSQGISTLLEILNDIGNYQFNNDYEQRIIKSASWFKNRDCNPETHKLIADFINSSQILINNTGAECSLPGEEQNINSLQPTIDEDCAELDPRFLQEYIETHTSMLEDFEALLLGIEEPSDGDLVTALKRYLHNLKGDSGSIGLTGIEKVCHLLEDQLVSDNLNIELIIPVLISFKEWVLNTINSYRVGEKPKCSAKQFINLFNVVGNSTSNKQKNESIVNQELLDELLKEDENKISTSTSNSESYKLEGESDILIEFAAEAEEHLDNVETIILDTQSEISKDSVDTLFRAVHSLKGGSAYFNLIEIKESSHILENLLSEARDGKRIVDEGLVAILASYTDLQKKVLNKAKKSVNSGGTIEYSPDYVKFMTNLDQYVKSGKSNLTAKNSSEAEHTSSSSVKAAKDDSSDNNRSESTQVKSFVKVDTSRLDHLVDSIGEMVIYSSMLIRQCRELLPNNQQVIEATHRVEKFGRDLQDVGMSMRLVPIKGLFQKMSRLVWDTSRKLGKQIEFEMDGEETELDRNLIDKLADPLMHMVRNSLDHGIEPPDERAAKGKSKTGKVILSAKHSAGSIQIQIKDDGRGLDPEKLKAKAIEKGIITTDHKLTNEEAFKLIFAAGFSTAAKVTDISGRGVGMDVVRRNVESLRGRINIQSEVGKGSIFTIELPLTLAIMDGIQVACGTESFLIPSLSIVEFVIPRKSLLHQAFEKAETYEFRGKQIPLFRLSDLYEIPSSCSSFEDSTIVIVEDVGSTVAILVDEILGEYSTVIKSLGGMFEEGKGVAGCAIMPQGNVSLILDVRTLLAYARTNYKRIYSDKLRIDNSTIIHLTEDQIIN